MRRSRGGRFASRGRGSWCGNNSNKRQNKSTYLNSPNNLDPLDTNKPSTSSESIYFLHLRLTLNPVLIKTEQQRKDNVEDDEAAACCSQVRRNIYGGELSHEVLQLADVGCKQQPHLTATETLINAETRSGDNYRLIASKAPYLGKVKLKINNNFLDIKI